MTYTQLKSKVTFTLYTATTAKLNKMGFDFLAEQNLKKIVQLWNDHSDNHPNFEKHFWVENFVTYSKGSNALIIQTMVDQPWGKYRQFRVLIWFDSTCWINSIYDLMIKFFFNLNTIGLLEHVPYILAYKMRNFGQSRKLIFTIRLICES